MGKEYRAAPRVAFQHGYSVCIMGIDGTWRRECTMINVSESGVLLAMKDPIAGLDLREFFLLLSATGLAYRRCGLVRVDGDKIGAKFLKPIARPNSELSRVPSSDAKPMDHVS